MRMARPVFVALLAYMVAGSGYAQVVEVFPTAGYARLGAEEGEGFEMLGGGFVDYGLNGQIQASAEVVKIYVGEPDGFYLPLYLLTGATSGELGTDELNKGSVFDLVTPTGGTVNACTNAYLSVFSTRKHVTRVSLSGFLSGRLVAGRDINTTDSRLAPAVYADIGLTFQTGAWLANGTYEKGGIFWSQAKYAVAYASDSDLEALF
ncbi:MAG: hypothetical protein ABIH26_01800, partial [Candidatus Eisenbacteria bacterium]